MNYNTVQHSMSNLDPYSKIHIVFLGDSGFPIGLAAIQRITLMARALMHANCKVTVVCRKGVWKPGLKTDLGVKGTYEGIDYQYTSDDVFRPRGFVKRNFQKVKGIFREYAYLKKLKKEGKLHIAILSTMTVSDALRYSLLSASIGFPIVLNLVEMASSIENRTFFLTKFNDYVFDKWVIKLFQGALPISDKLVEYYRSVAPAKPCMKLPVICDFDLFGNIKKEASEPYFLYCGSIGFIQVANFVLGAYRRTTGNNKVKLYMIVSGRKVDQIALLQQKIDAMFSDQQVKLFSNIPYEQLTRLFTNAQALLIPLRPSLQDTARFPHKIGEYLATGNPVITTDVGEIKTYFEDEKTALVAASYSEEAFSDKMEYVLANPEQSIEIGLNGRELGLKEFHYKSYGIVIRSFLQQVRSS